MGPAPRFALVIDQFEEIITGHPDRWREREGFFRQLDAALQANPNLWIVLSLREDYVAALDPYAPLVFNRLRARFYMERMGVAAALDAIRKPAELAGRPFAEGVSEKLADNLRQVRVAGQEATVAGQYVEPVQLQVVCYQLWENIKDRPSGLITTTDLAEAGDVDRALTQFYEETLTLALADPSAQGVSERQVRAWFDEQLITEAGTRGLVHQGERETGGLPNAVVSALQRRFLVRAEARGGDTWIELVHDRFVQPIRASNAAWFPVHLSILQRQAKLWHEQGRSSGLLLTGDALSEAERWAEAHHSEMAAHEEAFLVACRDARDRVEREHALIKELQEALDQAERSTRRARAGELTAHVQLELARPIYDPSLALLLALEAVAATWAHDGYVSPRADAALQDAISRAQVLGWVMTLPHGDNVTSAAWSPDGAQIVTASGYRFFGGDKTARIWDAATGEALHTLSGHGDDVTSAAWSPDGAQIVTASDDGTARIWDAATGEALRTLSGHSSSVTSAAWSPDGAQIVTASGSVGGGDGTARIWDAATGEAVRTLSGHSSVGTSAAWSPDGAQIVTASWDRTARIWDAATGEAVRTLSGHSSSVTSAAWSPDGAQIVTAGDDGTARIWDAATGEAVRTLSGHSSSVTSAAWSPDGAQIVTASGDGTARIWDAAIGEALRTIRGHYHWVTSAAWSPDGAQIVTASSDATERIWDAATGKEVRTLSGNGRGMSAAWSPDGAQIVTASFDGTALIWDAATGHELRTLSGLGSSVLSAAWSPDGAQIVTVNDQFWGDGDNTPRIWDAATGEELRTLSGHSGIVTSAAWSPDGAQIVTAGDDGTARIWDAATGTAVGILSSPSGPITLAAWSPDGVQIVTASGSIVGGGDKTARIWDAATGEAVRTLSGHSAEVTSAAWSPDGAQIVTASGDWTARIWDARTGQEVRTLSGHDGGLSSAAWSPDGRAIVTASKDRTARIWIARIDDLLVQAARLIQRVPPVLTPKERARFGLE
jgi:WD40 repeat protein